MEFDYARNALRYLIRTYGIKEIYIPYYLCDVIRHAIFQEGAKAIFYHIDDNFMPTKDFPKESFILYPNYFGICDKNVFRLNKIYPKLIVDNAHALYAEPMGFASFNSLRKFLPVESGAYLWTGGAKKIFPPNYIRREEFMGYHRKLFKTNKIKINPDEIGIPFCYPYLAESINDADSLVKKLSLEGKTIYRYWNPLPKSYNEYKFYSRLVPIPLKISDSHPIQRNVYRRFSAVSNSILPDSLLRQTDAPGT